MRRRYQVRWGSIYVSKPTHGRNRNGINIMVDANGVSHEQHFCSMRRMI